MSNVITRTLFSRLISSGIRPSSSSVLRTTVLSPVRSYKSSISLDKLYPQSSLSISKIPDPPKNEPDKFSGYIPMDKLDISYSKSGGPGGMNVNKLNTKVTVKFNVNEAESWIPEVVFKSFKDKFRNLISKDGYISVQSDRTRYQHLNIADALQKIREMIRACEVEFKEPDPVTVERHRRLREKAARERLMVKKQRSSIKQSRGAV